uniref:Serine-threonine/tyrosine-protein kinase catalytic domain-containing protein n=1 Tax=Plectus sambesii TaxID=2011161 RepID=A0A914X4B2_9BILA
MATVPFDASLRHLLLDPSDLKETGQRLGEGQYGVVWAAVWTCKDTRKEVKTQKAFILNELKILSQIRAHKYVIGLVGALEDSIVFEFCEFGSLEDFLIVCLNADWWTLGVLFWTVFSLGSEQPPTTQMREFMKKTHQVPSRPKFAPYEIYALMLDLWMLDPEDRADLRECKTKIKRQLKASCLPLVEELMKIDKEIEIQQLQQHQPEENQQQVTEGHQQHHYQPHQYQQQHQYQQPLKQQQQQQQQQQEPLETEENQEQEPINPEEGKAKKKSLYSKDAKRRLRLLEHKRKLLCGFSVITLLLVILLIWCLWNFILPIDTNKPSLEGPERNDSNNTEQPNITGPLESTLVPIIEKQRDDTSTIPYDSLTSAGQIIIILLPMHSLHLNSTSGERCANAPRYPLEFPIVTPA